MIKKNIYLAFTIQKSAVSDYYLQLVQLLNEKYNVFIFSPQTDYVNQIDIQGVKVFVWPNSRPTKFKDFIFLTKKIIRHRPVIMISAFGSVNLFAIVGFLLFIKNRIAWVHTLSSQMKSHKFLDLRKKMVYRFCTLLISNSEATKMDLVKKFSVSQSKIKVVYNSTVSPDIKETTLNFRKITYAGRIHVSKGVDVLIKAMSLIIDEYPELELEIVGAFLEGEAIQRYLKLTKELNLDKNIKFIGWKSKRELLEIFRNSYFTVVPSLAEAFGYVVIESFSVKTPVIGSNTGGIAEIIRDGKDGFLFTPGDSEELSKKMKYLLSNSDLRENLSKSCYDRFLNNFESEKVLRKFMDYLLYLS